MPSIIVLGDKTTHGGTVVTASPFTSSHGKGWARVGDMVACKKCRGIFPIVEGDPSTIDHGKTVAYHGCRVQCGARLISSQQVTTTQPAEDDDDDDSWGDTLGEDWGDDANAAREFSTTGPIAEGRAASYEEEPADSSTDGAQPHDRSRFRGRFRIIDDKTGAAIAGETVVVTRNGEPLSVTTDDEGYTTWVDRDVSESLWLELPAQERP